MNESETTLHADTETKPNSSINTLLINVALLIVLAIVLYFFGNFLIEKYRESRIQTNHSIPTLQ